MKKKLLILSLSSAVALGVVASAVLFSQNNKSLDVRSVDDYWTISFDALDVMGSIGGAYRSGDVVLKTDQNKNDVTFHYEDCYAREFNETNYLEVNKEDGYFANVTELRSMASINFYAAGTFKIEWGFVKDGEGNIQYESSVEEYISFQHYECIFEGTYPNYFKISNLDEVSRQLTDFVVKMDKSCQSSSSPYVFKSGVKYVKHETYAECLGFASGSLTSLSIAAEVDDLPVTKIADEAFKEDTTITSVSLPSSLIEIGDEAFRDCSNIAAINIPKSVRTIGVSSFDGTTGCTSLTFESGGTETLSLGRAAFDSNGHSGILTLPSRISGLSYDGYVFRGMMDVTSFALNSDNHASNIVSVEDGVLFANMGNYNYYQKVLVSYPSANSRTEYTIPSDCTRIMCYDGLAHSYNITKLIIDNDVDLYFDGYSAQSMINLEEIEFKESTNDVILYWYALNYLPKLYSITVPENLIVRSSGLESVTNHCLHVYLPGSSIPTSWSNDWCGSDIDDGYVKVFYHDETEPATVEEKLTHWHYVSDVPTPYAIEVLYYCNRTDIGQYYAFYLLGVDSWTPSPANRGSFNSDRSRWEVTLVMEPNTEYEFKGAISTWDSPSSISYEEGANRKWTPDRFSCEYEIDWHY